MDWAEIGKWALAAVGAMAAFGITFRFVINRNSNNPRTVVKDNKVGGDIIVGNKTTDSQNRR